MRPIRISDRFIFALMRTTFQAFFFNAESLLLHRVLPPAYMMQPRSHTRPLLQIFGCSVPYSWIFISIPLMLSLISIHRNFSRTITAIIFVVWAIIAVSDCKLQFYYNIKPEKSPVQDMNFFRNASEITGANPDVPSFHTQIVYYDCHYAICMNVASV